MIDNYDSFTYNIVSYLRILKEEVIVKKNDEINLEEIKQLNP
ncbi:MAG: aminodeoxychorismate/anthranilate synthase component II, partial [Finegoldia magna]|nr:aminodeoxychorismate/anthranilate synthase component II [Finegoldia magna]